MNIITIAGRVGRDAEIRHAGDSQVARFSVADDQYKKDAPTIWWSVDLWGDRAAKLAPHIVKGGHVTVTGNVQQREHDGKTFYSVRCVDIALQGGKPNANEAQAPRQASRKPAPTDDEIPF